MAKKKNTNDDPEKVNQSGESEDNFGLPEIEYKPLDRPAETSDASTSSQDSKSGGSGATEEKYVYRPTQEKSSASTILWMVLALVVVVAGVLYYQFVYKPKKEKEKQELVEKQAADKKAKEEAAERQRAAAEAERLRLEEEARNAKPAVGTITTLTERTRRYYVIVSSNIDDDLLMDYAKRLTSKGINLQLIPPYGNVNFYRLAIGDHDTYAIAQTSADASKGEYGENVWVLRY